MTVEQLLTILGTLAYSVLSAMIPVLNAEIYLLGASALLPRSLAIPLVVAGSVGQMIGKLVMYYAARGALHLPNARLQRAVATVHARYANSAALGDVVLFSSSTLGLPPFYIVTVAAGVLRIPVVRFTVIGLVGRLLRFGVVVLAPQLVKELGR